MLVDGETMPTTIATAMTLACVGLFAAAFTTMTPVAAQAGDVDFTYCPGWASDLKVTRLSYEPFPPKINRPVYVTWIVDLAVPLKAGAKVIRTSTLGAMIVAKTEMDLCAELAGFGLTCPVPSGKGLALKSEYTFPKGVKPPPFVTINIREEFYNGDGSKLGCIETTAKFVP